MKHVAATVMTCAAACLIALPSAAYPQVQVDGYRIDRYWTPGGGDARALLQSADGRIWVGCGDGSVHVLEGVDASGKAKSARLFTRGVWNPNGLAWRKTADGKGQELFVCHTTARHGGGGRISRLIDEDGNGQPDGSKFVILDLPPGAHQTCNLAFGPDGMLYFAQGATSDRGPGGGALIGKVDPDAEKLRWRDQAIKVVATGLRNPWGIAFHPWGVLLATDNVSDKLGEATPPDELNVIEEGRDYGFPKVEGRPPAGHESVGPIADLGIHAAASGICVDTKGRFPGFQGQAIVAKWGSWTGDPGSTAGSGLVRVQLHRSKGEWKTAVHPLVRNCGRPLDVVIGDDGALYFTVQNSTRNWPEAVYRMTPSVPLTLRVDGAPGPGAALNVAVHAPSRPNAQLRVRLVLPRASQVHMIELDGSGRASVPLTIPRSSYLAGGTIEVEASLPEIAGMPTTTVPIRLF